MRNSSLAYLYVMAVPYLAGLCFYTGSEVGGFHYTGYIWAAFSLIGLTVFFLEKLRPRFPDLLWLPWFGFVLLSLVWVETYKLRNLQTACHVVSPVVVGFVASAAIQNERQLRSLRRGFTHCLVILVLAVAISQVTQPVGIYLRPMALTACFVGCIYVASFRLTPYTSILGWAVCLGFAVLTGSRMATLALLFLWIIYPYYRRRETRWLFAVAMAVLGVSLLFIPSFRSRFAEPEPGIVGQIHPAEISSSGRFALWPLLWEKAKEKIVLGWGAGSSTDLVELAWPGITEPHNDYLRIIFEQGFVGLGIFLTAAVGQMALLRREIRRCDGEKKIGFVTAYLALAVLLVVSFTENTIVYGLWYMHPLFAVLGGAYGVRYAGRPSAQRPMLARFGLRAHAN